MWWCRRAETEELARCKLDAGLDVIGQSRGGVKGRRKVKKKARRDGEGGAWVSGHGEQRLSVRVRESVVAGQVRPGGQETRGETLTRGRRGRRKSGRQ